MGAALSILLATMRDRKLRFLPRRDTFSTLSAQNVAQWLVEMKKLASALSHLGLVRQRRGPTIGRGDAGLGQGKLGDADGLKRFGCLAFANVRDVELVHLVGVPARKSVVFPSAPVLLDCEENRIV